MVVILPKNAKKYYKTLESDRVVVVEYTIPTESFWYDYNTVLDKLEASRSEFLYMRVNAHKLKIQSNRSGIRKQLPAFAFWKGGRQLRLYGMNRSATYTSFDVYDFLLEELYKLDKLGMS